MLLNADHQSPTLPPEEGYPCLIKLCNIVPKPQLKVFFAEAISGIEL